VTTLQRRGLPSRSRLDFEKSEVKYSIGLGLIETECYDELRPRFAPLQRDEYS